MVIFLSKGGQLCNRLWHFSHVLVNSRQYGYALVSDSLAEYGHYFSEALSALNADNSGTRVLRPQDRLLRVFLRLCRLLHRFRGISRYLPFYLPIHFLHFSWEEGEYYNLRHEEFRRCAKYGLVTLDGWFFMDRQSMRERRDWLRKTLSPNPEVLETCTKYVGEARENADVIVGVHIRRGDYAKYYAGEFFYTHEEYKSWMQEIAAALGAEGKVVRFLICSNEKVDLHFYEPLYVQRGPGSEIHDLYALTKCDYILGPPSSYSAWASFMGEVPLCVIRSRNDEVSLSSFTVADVYPPDGPVHAREPHSPPARATAQEYATEASH